MTDRYQGLRDAIAAGPTSGRWRVSNGIVDNPRLIVEDDLGLPVCAMSLRGVHGDLRKMEARARLIAAADPDTIAALLADYDRLQRELEFIAYANPSRWDADMRDQFQEWAQNRARAALADGEAQA